MNGKTYNYLRNGLNSLEFNLCVLFNHIEDQKIKTELGGIINDITEINDYLYYNNK